MCSLEKSGNTFMLTLKGDGVDEHRLNRTLISSIQAALSDAKLHSDPTSVFITIAHGKFFSNGLDLNRTSDSIINDVQHMNEMFKNLISQFISLPMPTIAIVTGHAAGAGVLLALCHDYVVMRRDRGFLYMNEIHIGISLHIVGVELIRSKVGKPNHRRDILLRGVNLKADEAVETGLVDTAYEDEASTVQGGIYMGVELAKMKRDGELYAEMRKSLYPELCSLLGLGCKSVIKPRL